MNAGSVKVFVTGACKRTLRQSGIVVLATAGVIAAAIGVAILLWPTILAIELADIRTVAVENGDKWTIKGDSMLFAAGVIANIIWAAFLLNGFAALLEYSETAQDEAIDQ